MTDKKSHKKTYISLFIILLLIAGLFFYLREDDKPQPTPEPEEVVKEPIQEPELIEEYYLNIYNDRVEYNVIPNVPILVTNYKNSNAIVIIRAVEVGENEDIDFTRLSEEVVGISLLLEHNRDPSKQWAREPITQATIVLPGSDTDKYFFIEKYGGTKEIIREELK